MTVAVLTNSCRRFDLCTVAVLTTVVAVLVVAVLTCRRFCCRRSGLVAVMTCILWNYPRNGARCNVIFLENHVGLNVSVIIGEQESLLTILYFNLIISYLYLYIMYLITIIYIFN